MTQDLSIGCLQPGCGKVRKLRGVCTNCYAQLSKLVKAGKTTWAAEEAAGHALAPSTTTVWGDQKSLQPRRTSKPQGGDDEHDERHED